jgi:hypothetical protein
VYIREKEKMNEVTESAVVTSYGVVLGNSEEESSEDNEASY